MTDMTTQIAELREIVGRMTPGECAYDGGFIISRDDSLIVCAPETAPDAAGIVALRNTALPIIDAQAAEIERLREVLTRIAQETTAVTRDLTNCQMCIQAVNAVANEALTPKEVDNG